MASLYDKTKRARSWANDSAPMRVSTSSWPRRPSCSKVTAHDFARSSSKLPNKVRSQKVCDTGVPATRSWPATSPPQKKRLPPRRPTHPYARSSRPCSNRSRPRLRGLRGLVTFIPTVTRSPAMTRFEASSRCSRHSQTIRLWKQRGERCFTFPKPPSPR